MIGEVCVGKTAVVQQFINAGTAFPKVKHTHHRIRRVSHKRRPFLKIENFPDLLSNDMDGKIVEISTLNILEMGRL